MWEFSNVSLDQAVQAAHAAVGVSVLSINSDLADFEERTRLFLLGEIPTPTYLALEKKTGSFGDPKIVEVVKDLSELAHHIYHEKGFRYLGSIMSYNEHRKIGSTVDSGYSKFPDLVANIAAPKVGIDRSEKMSVEEIRIARLLIGMKTIDDEGNVTDESIPVTDSYHFLSPERKSDVKDIEKYILRKLSCHRNEALLWHLDNFNSYVSTVRSLDSGDITAPKAYESLTEMFVPERYEGDFKTAIDMAKQAAYDKGNRNDILTPQELILLGHGIDSKYIDSPYVPLGIQDGGISVSYANRIRSEEGYFIAVTDLFFGHDSPSLLSLEQLDEKGSTMRGPQILDSLSKEPMKTQMIDKIKERMTGSVPHSRPVDWYHQSG